MLFKRAWMLVAFTMCLTHWAHPQTTGSSLADLHARWRLLPDSMAVGPYADLKAFAVERAVRNAQLRDCAWLYYFADRETEALRKAKAHSDGLIKAQEDRADMILAKNYELTDDLIKCQGKRKSPNIAGIAIGFGIGSVIFGTVAMLVSM